MKGYLFCNTPDIVRKSSSGGAYSAIITTTNGRIHNKLAIYGAAFDEKLMVVHKKYTAEDYEPLRGSKYCFSRYSPIMSGVKDDLNKGEYVIFTGTPCQVFALKSFLNKEKIGCDKLLTIDLICHGSPDIKLWCAYKNWLEKRHKKRLNIFKFRYKDARWNGYSLMAEFEDSKRIVNTHDLQVYMDLYFTHQVMRKSCYTCRFASTERFGDITLGDFWGAEDIFPEMVSNSVKKRGISLMIPNTEKGLTIIKQMIGISADQGWLIKECVDDSFVKYQTGLNAPVEKPKDYDEFCQFAAKNDFDAIVKKYAGFNFKGKLRYWTKYMANFLGLIK